MPNTYACKGVSNPNIPIFPPRVCTLVLFIFLAKVTQTTATVLNLKEYDNIYSHPKFEIRVLYTYIILH